MNVRETEELILLLMRRMGFVTKGEVFEMVNQQITDALNALKAEFAADIAGLQTQLANAVANNNSVDDVVAAINQATADIHSKYAPSADATTGTANGSTDATGSGSGTATGGDATGGTPGDASTGAATGGDSSAADASASTGGATGG